MQTLSRALRPHVAQALLALALTSLALPACKSDNSGTPDSGTPDAGPVCTAPSTSTAFTLHYHRPAGDYTGWSAAISAGSAQATVASSSTDNFGAVYAITLTAAAPKLSLKMTSAGGDDAAGVVDIDTSCTAREGWVFAGSTVVATGTLPAIPAATGEVAVYYTRRDGLYGGWGLHTWGDVVTETQWTTPLAFTGIDPVLGAGFIIKVKAGADQINVIAHSGDTKDPGPDMGWSIAKLGNIVFITSGSSTITAGPQKVGGLQITGAAAHLIARDTLVWDVVYNNANGVPIKNVDIDKVELRYSATAEIAVKGSDVVGGTTLATTKRPSGLTAAQKLIVPHLADRATYDVAAGDLAKVKEALKGQLLAIARKADNTILAVTQMQTAVALDDLYAYDGALGVTFAAGVPSFSLWAPTAQTCKLYVYDASKAQVAAVDMTPGANGVWTTTGQAAWMGDYYRYELDVYHYSTGKIEHVKVTDPYSVNLDTNGNFSHILDLNDPATQPAGWSALTKASLTLDQPEDIAVYEGHIRDFSILDATTPADRRGKYLGFVTDPGQTPSNGLKHLAALAAAGMTHFHVLPAFDLATVEEDASKRIDLDATFAALCARNTSIPAATCTQYGTQKILDVLKSLPGDSDQQQQIATWMSGLDGFNWGYDPFHYGAPEGSYASTAEGAAKVLEFRSMVKGLADVGLRLALDVVYNHTNAAGLGEHSVLDKVVPGYYHRFDADNGFLMNNSCCADTATEHKMMEKLMVDTVVQWAVQYKIDAFRFDIMGLQTKAGMLKAQSALKALTIAHDGVDGSKIYVYGEGWSQSAVVAARGALATQLGMPGTGIGTFNDRIRDGVRGGGPFDFASGLRSNQGFTSGLFTDPNELETSATSIAADKDQLGVAADLIKTGMAGGLADFKFLDRGGNLKTGSSLSYSGQPAGYTQDPQESLNYVSVHDNQTLWDIMQYKYPTGRSMADRVRSYNQSLDIVLLGQGVPLFHMGDDLLRSKSMEHDSYNSGDWFNRIDFSYQGNNWKVGLPNAGKDQGNWPIIRPLFADASIAPTVTDLTASKNHFTEMLKVRKSSRLFRLTTKDDVMKRVDFLNTGTSWTPGVLVMTVTDGTCAGADLDPAREAVVVIVNADKVSHDLTVPGASGFALHPVLAASSDPVVKTSSVSGAVFTVPARTTAVFEKAQSGGQGTGLACNTH
jgi:pullulanase-type alpha-1,6-glucosidase